MVKGKIDQKDVTLLNVYAPPWSKIDFFKKVFNLISTETQGTLICAGDFNLLLNSQLDSNNIYRRNSSTDKRIKRMLADLGLIDMWRPFHGSTPGFTFYSARHSVYSRIDYCFMYNRELNRVKNCRIGQQDFSDYSGVYLTLRLDGRLRKTLWRPNTGMLNDTIFVKEMTTDFTQYLQDNNNGETNPSIVWDAAKAVLRGK